MSLGFKIGIVLIVVGIAASIAAVQWTLWDNCWSKSVAEMPGWCLLFK